MLSAAAAAAVLMITTGSHLSIQTFYTSVLCNPSTRNDALSIAFCPSVCQSFCLSVCMSHCMSVCVCPSVCLTCTHFNWWTTGKVYICCTATLVAISRSKGRMAEFMCALKLQLKHQRLRCIASDSFFFNELRRYISFYFYLYLYFAKLRRCMMADICVSVFVCFFLNVIIHIYWCDKNVIW